MTGTAITDVSALMGSAAATVGRSAKGFSQDGFQQILDSRTGREQTPETLKDDRTAVRKTPGESMKAREEHLLRHTDGQTDGVRQKPADGLTEEELEEAMEVLETVAAGVLQQLADTLGVSGEEVQAAMEELGMEDASDVLQPGRLGELFLKLADAEDSYALVTNGELYDDYRELMTQLGETLKSAGEELGLEPEELTGLLQDLREEPLQELPDKPELPKQAEELPQDEGGQNVQELSGEQTVQETDKPENTGAETTGEEHGREEGEHRTADRGDALQPVQQNNLTTGQLQPEAEQPLQGASPWDADTQDIMRQIMDYMKIQVRADSSQMEMQLHPASLGTVQVQVASKGGEVTASFITQNETVKAALESQLLQLQQSFEEQGIRVNSIEVSVQTGQLDRNLEQGRENGKNQEPDRRNRTRRIQLDDSLAVEDMAQEDALAAKLLAADGNTVDYTA